MVGILNNTPNSSGFTPKEIFTGVKGDRSLKNFHTFSSPCFVLNATIQKGNKLPTWKPRSIPCVFVGKSKEHASNVSLVYNPATNHLSPQFHIVHDDDFQTATSNNNSLPLNWKEVFETSHFNDDPSFTTPLEAKTKDKTLQVKVRRNKDANIISSDVSTSPADINDNVDDDAILASPMVASEGEPSDIDNEPVHSDSERDGSFAQNHTLSTQSGRRILKPQRFLPTAILGLLSSQGGVNIENSLWNKPPSIFKAQMEYHQELHTLVDNTFNDLHPLSLIASKANNDVLYYYQAMKADNTDEFRKVMKKEIGSFNEEKIFKLIPISKKPDHKSLIPFI